MTKLTTQPEVLETVDADKGPTGPNLAPTSTATFVDLGSLGFVWRHVR